MALLGAPKGRVVSGELSAFTHLFFLLESEVARGGTQGGLNCLTHVLPRRLPTPTEEADGNGYGAITGRGGPSRPPSRVSVNLVPLLLTGVSLHPPAPKGGPTRTSADVSVPRLAGFSLIT